MIQTGFFYVQQLELQMYRKPLFALGPFIKFAIHRSRLMSDIRRRDVGIFENLCDSLTESYEFSVPLPNRTGKRKTKMLSCVEMNVNGTNVYG